MIMYLMECILCNKQYVGKAETSFNIRLNNHRKDVNSRHNNGLQAFSTGKSQFQQTCKIYHIIDQLTNTSKSKETLTQRIVKEKIF